MLNLATRTPVLNINIVNCIYNDLSICKDEKPVIVPTIEKQAQVLSLMIELGFCSAAKIYGETICTNKDIRSCLDLFFIEGITEGGKGIYGAKVFRVKKESKVQALRIIKLKEEGTNAKTINRIYRLVKIKKSVLKSEIVKSLHDMKGKSINRFIIKMIENGVIERHRLSGEDKTISRYRLANV